MKNHVGTAYDQNPARVQILVRRNRKAVIKRRIYLAGSVSIFISGFAWIAKQISQ